MSKNELNDLSEVIHREREDLMDRIRELTREIRLKHIIIDQFIPTQEYMRIERRKEKNEDTNEWVIPIVEFTGNNKKNQKAKKKESKKGGQINQFLFEHILNMD